MKKHALLTLILAACTFGLLLTGCGNNEEAELKSVIERNLKGCQEENLEMALMDIDDGPAKENTRMVLKKLFETYDLSYKLVSFKVISCDQNTATVEVVQETRKISGPAFQDNAATAIHTLQKRPSGWKIVSSAIKEVKKL